MSDSFLSVRNMSVDFYIHEKKRFPWSKPQILKAVNNISFELPAGKTLGIVGESGCGKSTLVNAIAGLEAMKCGEVYLDGEKINYTSSESVRKARRTMQMIFQDPIASLNPRMTVRDIVAEPLKIGKFAGDHGKMVRDMLDRVGIPHNKLNSYAHEFSGGQCQRIGIARSLITQPKLLLCDEPVSALDVSVQAQVVNLLKEMQEEMNLSLVFVAHDLGVVRHISDEIMVMYLGGMMELTESEKLINSARHPYSAALLSSVPSPDPREVIQPQILSGELPSPLDLPAGCLFSTRCPYAEDRCKKERPETKFSSGRAISCFYPLN